MKPVSYISDDGQCEGSEAKVREYEERQKDPLGWLALPVYVVSDDDRFVVRSPLRALTIRQLDAYAAIINLAPDFLAMFQRSNQLLEDGDDTGWTQQMMAFISELEPKFMAAIKEPK